MGAVGRKGMSGRLARAGLAISAYLPPGPLCQQHQPQKWGSLWLRARASACHAGRGPLQLAPALWSPGRPGSWSPRWT